METMRKISIFLFILIWLTGCEKFVTVAPPITQLVSSTVFESDQTALSAMNGLYSYMESTEGFADGGTGSVGFLAGLSTDELTNYGTDQYQIQFYQNALTSNNVELDGFLWQVPYQCIYQANSILAGLAGSNQVSAPLKNELMGEAKFIRAFSFFYLVNLFGNVPLILSTDYQTNAITYQTPIDSIYLQIIADLTSSQTLLASDYSYSNGERVRPNSWAASAMLARVYLYLGKWQDAEAQSTSVINQNSLFSILPDLNQVFLANSNEAIWQLMPTRPGNNTGEGNIYILTSEPLYASLSPSLIGAFDSGDLRKQNWVADTTIGPTTYFFAYKYKVKTSTEVTEYSMVLRLAEQYLIRAEARAEQQNISGAQEDLNVIRNRAGLTDFLINNQDSLLKAIMQERQVELFTEWGHRWLDLKRTNQSTQILSPIKINWQPTDSLYPIPQSDIQKDPNLTQNPGY